MKILKKIGKILLAVLIIIAAALLFCFVNHRLRLASEAELLDVIGNPVTVNGHSINVYTEGNGDTTLVFMSGSGTCSPVLDFKSLYSLLSGDCTIAVVEKSGYGFSEISDSPRDIDTILDETRQALALSGLEAPYTLCPHSMSGIEALYWAQKYPDEVSGIIGLDMAVPKHYENMEINGFLLRAGHIVAELGITRLIPSISESDAIKYGTLTEHEKEIYRAVFYTRTLTPPMIAEAEAIKESAAKVAERNAPQVPILMFLSDGSGGTGFSKEEWRGISEKYASEIAGSKYIELDCPHYVHDHEYEKIAEEIKSFLSENDT